MQAIRVLIAEMPHLLRDILEEIIARQADIDVVGVVETVDDLRREIHSNRADVVLCRLDGSELPTVYQELFDVHPRLRLLAIDAGDRNGCVYELRPERTRLDVWPQGLVDAIRSTGSSPRTFAWDVRAEDR